MRRFPDNLLEYGISTRCRNMLLNSRLASIEEVDHVLRGEFPQGESFFLRIPGAGRVTLDELQEALKLWRKEQGNAERTVEMFTECLDRLLEAERDLVRAAQSGADMDPIRERHKRLRSTIITSFQGLIK